VRRVAALGVATLVALGTTGVGYLVGAAGAGEPAAIGPGVVRLEVSMKYSRYSIPADLRVRQGTLVEFVVTNDDPINHELIVGDDSVHARHENGHEPYHPPVPGEVSVAPGERGLTTFLFDSPGTVRYVCHLPGHAAYGMQGEITVVPAAS
jgi:uncharacterized cupredoxin-like copper-binding protein